MELSSNVVATLDEWVENGFINAAQREAFAELMQNEVTDAYNAGYNDYRDDGYDSGWDDGYNAGQSEFEAKRDEWFEWFEQGWAEALLEHGIEE